MSSQLFQPIKVGTLSLTHRIVLAPLTRFKASKTLHVPFAPLVSQYYSQRGSTPGTLLITEATFIAAKAGGWNNIPGIWSLEQIEAWKQITEAVHAKGSYIFLQLWALGRAAKADMLVSEDPSFSFVAPSPIPLSARPEQVPRALTIPEIKEYPGLFAQAAKNAIHGAGFDGVEIHSANGALLDQFLQDVSNQRTDEYGGSVEARSKFALEVVDAVVDAVGAEKTGVRMSPWSSFHDMKMKHPVPQFTDFVSSLKSAHPDLAYIHVVDPKIDGNVARDPGTVGEHESNDFLRAIWSPRPFISTGGYTRESAMKAADETGDLIAFGRQYISNPGLPLRLEKNIALTPYDRSRFYVSLDIEGTEVGYADYPFGDSLE